MLLKGSTSAIFEVFKFGVLPFPEGHPSVSGSCVTPTYVVYERQSTEKETVEKVQETPIFADPPDNYQTRLTGPDKIENF